MHSQNQEEKYILDHFAGKDNGRFLDIGAYSIQFSNTHALANLGWSGVCIEPSPSPFISLMQAYKDNSNIKLVNAAISYKETGLVDFADSNGDAISTTNPVHEAKWSSAVKYQHIYVNTVTIREILRVFGEKFDFISLDVEGTNIEILKTIPLDIIQPSLICIEHELRFAEIFEYCKGYSEVHRNGENVILKK